MAKLTTNEKEILEELFQIRGGYVLNFSDRTFGESIQNDMALIPLTRTGDGRKPVTDGNR